LADANGPRWPNADVVGEVDPMLSDEVAARSAFAIDTWVERRLS